MDAILEMGSEQLRNRSHPPDSLLRSALSTLVKKVSKIVRTGSANGFGNPSLCVDLSRHGSTISSATINRKMTIEKLLERFGHAQVFVRFIFDWQEGELVVRAELKTANACYAAVGMAKRENASDAIAQAVAALAQQI